MRNIKEAKIRQAEIMKAALDLFVEKGYLNTTTQDIIDKVGISRGLLYYHFKNKEDILYSLIKSYSEPLLRQLKKIADDSEQSAIEKIRNFIAVTMISQNSVTKEDIELQKTVDLEQNRYLMDKLAHYFIDHATDYLAKIIEQGISEESFDLENPYETAYLLMTGYIFTGNQITSSTQNGEAYLKAFKKLLERTLGAKKAIFEEL